MLRCKEVTHLLASDGLDDAPWTKRLAVRFHLMMCRHCHRYAAQLRAIGSATQKILGPQGESADPETIERLEKAILDKCPDGDQGSPPQ